MLDMGFQPQVDRIVRRLPDERQTMFFSATLDGEVGRLARAYTTNPVRHEAGEGAETVEDVDHRFVAVTQDTKLDTLIDLLAAEPDGHALVFVRTKRGADRLLARLKARGVSAAAMHGDMPQQARERAWDQFESGKVRDAGRDRCRRTRARPAVDQHRHQLRPARRQQGLHAPGRPHRPGRSRWHRRDPGDQGPAGRGQPDRPPPRPDRRVQQGRHDRRTAEARVLRPQGSSRRWPRPRVVAVS